MAQSYSLAVYSITINTRWKKDEKQVLSGFNNGQDFVQYIETILANNQQSAIGNQQSVISNHCWKVISRRTLAFFTAVRI